MNKKHTLQELLKQKEILIEVTTVFYHPQNNIFSFAADKIINKIEGLERFFIKTLQKMVDKEMQEYVKEREKLNIECIVVKDGKPTFEKTADGQLIKKIDQKKLELAIKKLDKKFPDNKKKWEKLHIKESILLKKEMDINVHMVEESNIPPMPRAKIILFRDFMIVKDNTLNLIKM